MKRLIQPDQNGYIQPADLLLNLFDGGEDVPDEIVPRGDGRSWNEVIGVSAVEAERLEALAVTGRLDNAERIWSIPSRRSQLKAASEVDDSASRAIVQFEGYRQRDLRNETAVPGGATYREAESLFKLKYGNERPPQTRGEAEDEIKRLDALLALPDTPTGAYGDAERQRMAREHRTKLRDALVDAYYLQDPAGGRDAPFAIRLPGERDLIENPDNPAFEGLSPILRSQARSRHTSLERQIETLKESREKFRLNVLKPLQDREELRQMAEQAGAEEAGVVIDPVTGKATTDPRMTGLVGEAKRFGVNVKRGVFAASESAGSSLATFIGGGKEDGAELGGVRGFQVYMTQLGRQLQSYSEAKEEGATADASRFAKMAYRATSGAARSGTEMGIAALTGGGSAAIIGYHSFTSAMQAYNSARDQGLSPDEAAAHAATIGAIEGSVTAAFQAVGLGGAEAMMPGATRASMEAVRASGMRGFVRDLMKGTAAELAEENLISVWQSYVNDVDRVAPGAFFTRDDSGKITGLNMTGQGGILDTMFETSLSTVMSTSAMQILRAGQYVETDEQKAAREENARLDADWKPPAPVKYDMMAARREQARRAELWKASRKDESKVAAVIDQPRKLDDERPDQSSATIDKPLEVVSGEASPQIEAPRQQAEMKLIEYKPSKEEVDQVVAQAKSEIVSLPHEQQTALTELAKAAIIADATGQAVEITPDAVNAAAPDLQIDEGDSGRAVLAAAAAVDMATTGHESKARLIAEVEKARAAHDSTDKPATTIPDVLPYPPAEAPIDDHIENGSYLDWAHGPVNDVVGKLPMMTPSQTLGAQRAVDEVKRLWANPFTKHDAVAKAALSLSASGDQDAAAVAERAIEQVAYKVRNADGSELSDVDANKVAYMAMLAMIRDKSAAAKPALSERDAELAARAEADKRQRKAESAAKSKPKKADAPAPSDAPFVSRMGDTLKTRGKRFAKPHTFNIAEAKELAEDFASGFEATGLPELGPEFMPDIASEMALAEQIVQRLEGGDVSAWQDAVEFQREVGFGWSADMHAARSMAEDGVTVTVGVDEQPADEVMRQAAALREAAGKWVLAHANMAKQAEKASAREPRTRRSPRKRGESYDMPSGLDSQIAEWLAAAVETSDDEATRSPATARIEGEYPAESVFTDPDAEQDAARSGLTPLSEAYAQAQAEIDRLSQAEDRATVATLDDDAAMLDRAELVGSMTDSALDSPSGDNPQTLKWSHPRYRNAFRRGPYSFIEAFNKAIVAITGRPWKFEFRFLRPGVDGTTYNDSAIARIQPGNWGVAAHEGGHAIGLWMSANNVFLSPNTTAWDVAQVLGMTLYLTRGVDPAKVAAMSDRVLVHEGIAEWVQRYVMEPTSLNYKEIDPLTAQMMNTLDAKQIGELNKLRDMAQAHKAKSVIEQEGSRFTTTQKPGLGPWLKRIAKSMTPQNLWSASALFRKIDAASKGKGRLTLLFNALTRTAAVTTNTFLTQHTTNATGQISGESLADIIKDAEKLFESGAGTEAGLNAFVLAKVQNDLINLVQSGHPQAEKIQTDVGIYVREDDNRAKAIVEDEVNFALYNNLAERLGAFMRRVHEYRAGRSTHYAARLQELDDVMQGAFYVPLRKDVDLETREMSSGTGPLSGSVVSPARTGAQGEQIINVLESVQNEVGRIIEQGHKQEMFEELKSIYDSKAIPDMNKWMQIVADSSGETSGVAMSLTTKSEKTDPNLVTFDEWYVPKEPYKRGPMKGQPKPRRKRTLTFRVDPQIMEDIEDMTRQEMVWLKRMGPVKRMMTAINSTSLTFALRLNPGYVFFRQIMMDAPGLYAKQAKGVTANPGVFISSWFRNTVANAVGGDRAAMMNMASDGLTFLRNNGIGDVTAVGYNSATAAENLETTLRRPVKSVKNPAHMLGLVADKAWRLHHKAVQIGESTQVGQMAATVEVTATARGIDLKTGTVTENGITRPMNKYDAAALIEAARALLPVHDRGRIWRDIEFILPLGMINLTDAKGTIDAIRRNKVRMGAVMGGLAVAGLANAFRFKDEEWWKKMTAGDLLNFWMQPAGDELLAWDMTGSMQQMTFGVGQAFGRVLIDAAEGDADNAATLEVVQAIAASFLPRSEAPVFDLTVGTITGSKTPITSLMGYREYDIIPARMKHLPGYQQYKDTTPFLYRHIAARLGRGGSPLMVQHIIDTLTGGLVTSAVQNIESALGMGRELMPHERFAIGRAFVAGGTEGSLSKTRQYTSLILADMELQTKMARGLETPEDVALREVVSSAMETISIMRWAKEKAGSAMPQEERERLDNIASDVAMAAYEMYKNREYSPAAASQAKRWRKIKESVYDARKLRDLQYVGLASSIDMEQYRSSPLPADDQ